MSVFLRAAPILVLLFAVSSAAGQSASLQKKINKAIDGGVEYLRNAFRGAVVNDQAPGSPHPIGMTAFAAWTLLETGMPADDPLVVRAAQFLRWEVVQSRNTYDLATAILFFDKLGRPGDEPLIQGMAIRLLGGQKKNGGWTYGSAAGPAVELPLETYMRSAINARKTAKPVPRTPRDLPAPVQQFLRAMGQPLPETGLGQSDGSNTQFAMLALWVARRHGLPVDQALLKVGDLFRKTQSKNGGWPYHLVPGEGENIRITMSCAGLLGIALEHGVAKKLKQERVPLAEDDAANNGLGLLGSYLATPSPESNRLLFVPGHFNYFLFSMERMAVVYDLKEIGGTDWYRLGAEKLVKSQQESGRWTGVCGAADTCFALLFLKRANVARDLTLDLKGIVRDTPANPKATPKKQRGRDPFEVPDIGPKVKKKASASPEKEDASGVQKTHQEFTQKRLWVEAKRKIATLENASGRRFLKAKL